MTLRNQTIMSAAMKNGILNTKFAYISVYLYYNM